MYNINPDRMRYQKNALSFWFCMLAIALNMGAFITSYTDEKLKPDIIIGLDVVINIVFMLVIFMGSEKSKAYILEWSYVLIGTGIVQFCRILIVPLIFMILGEITMASFVLNILFLSLSGVALIFGGVVCKKRSSILRAYLKQIEEKEKVGPTH